MSLAAGLHAGQSCQQSPVTNHIVFLPPPDAVDAAAETLPGSPASTTHQPTSSISASSHSVGLQTN